MRILLVDDHSIIRMALRHLLSELCRGGAITEAHDGASALSALTHGPLDLVVTDLFMPDTDRGYLKALVDGAGPAPIAVFTMSEDGAQARVAMALGVRAFIPKSTADDLIINILRLVLAGGTYLPPQLALAAAAIAHVPGGAGGPRGLADLPIPAGTEANPLAALTPRQLQVLKLLSEGLSNSDIGQRLNLNLSTVKTHVTGILRTLNVRNRTQAVLTFKQTHWT